MARTTGRKEYRPRDDEPKKQPYQEGTLRVDRRKEDSRTSVRPVFHGVGRRWEIVSTGALIVVPGSLRESGKARSQKAPRNNQGKGVSKIERVVPRVGQSGRDPPTCGISDLQIGVRLRLRVQVFVLSTRSGSGG